MNFYNNFDTNVQKYGISKASKILVDNLGLTPKVELKNFPQKGPVLIYSNHPTGLDPFLLASILKRDDFLFLGDKYHTKKGKNISKHIAPTLPTEKFLLEFIKRRPTNWFGFIRMRMGNKFNYLKAKKINSMAIKKIINNIIKGHASLVFPSGGEYEFLSWKKGLSIIVNELNRHKIKYTLYKIDIKNFSELKLIFHFLTFKKYFKNLLITGVKVDRIIK